MNSRQLEDLYVAHSGTVYAFAVRLTGGEAAAKDLMQTVFVGVARRPRLLIRNPRSFLLRCTYRAFVDETRRDATRQRTCDVFGVLFPSLAEPASLEDERLALLAAAVDTLPAEQGAVVHLKIWEERTFQEIGAILGISTNTAASHRYALDKLRTAMRLEIES